MKNHNQKNKKAFTLVEVLLYVVVLGICLTAMSGFIDMINAAKAKNRLVLEIERQGENITGLIKENIRNSSGIISPTIGTISDSLSLSFNDSSKNPTVFRLVNGVIYVKEGLNAEASLSNPSLNAKNLSFRNLGREATPGNINFSFSLESATNQRFEFSYQQSFSGTASRRY